jgi:molybdenum cofactor synthesis domain-containing protein
MKISSAILVCSDRSSAGRREDASGPAAREVLESWTDVHEKVIVPDDYAEIRAQLIEWCRGGVDLIFTLGGTGLSPRDVTPEATRSVIEKEVPAINQALLINGLKQTPKAMLSRAVAGIRGQTLIVNLPGSPRAVTGGIEYLKETLPHAIEVLRGEATE